LASDNLRKVGYAAYCLERMGSPMGIAVATKRRDAILGSQRFLDLPVDARFAVICLEGYMSHCNQEATTVSRHAP
jgi:hypothetical protein